MIGDRIQTSFDKGIHRFTWLMIRFMAVMVPLVFLINGLTKGDWGEAFLFALAVAVGLTPEMLPMILSANLAKGALVMSRHKVIVKRLSSIQNFGAMDVLCTDKTGTFTQDKVFLEKHVDINGNENERVLELAFLNSYYQSGLTQPAGRGGAGKGRDVCGSASGEATIARWTRSPSISSAAACQWWWRKNTSVTCSSARARSRRSSASARKLK